MNYNRASKGCASLNEFIRFNNVQDTSKSCYYELWATGELDRQCRWLYESYIEYIEGLTDQEMKKILKNKKMLLDASTISARRNDLNKKWVKEVEFKGLDYPQQFIVSIGQRKNGITDRNVNVWAINPIIRKNES